MHESTHSYLALGGRDVELHVTAASALRDAVRHISALREQAGAKSAALVDVQCDETHPQVLATLYEGHDRAKTTQRLATEWHAKTLEILMHLKSVEEYDARLAALDQPTE